MALDVHAQDVPGVKTDLVGVVRQLDATGLATTADAHLRLDDDRVPDLLRYRDRFVNRVGLASRRDGDAELGEVLLALILKQIHLRASFL